MWNIIGFPVHFGIFLFKFITGKLQFRRQKSGTSKSHFILLNIKCFFFFFLSSSSSSLLASDTRPKQTNKQTNKQNTKKQKQKTTWYLLSWDYLFCVFPEIMNFDKKYVQLICLGLYNARYLRMKRGEIPNSVWTSYLWVK